MKWKSLASEFHTILQIKIYFLDYLKIKKKIQKVKTFKAAGPLRKPPARRNKRSDWFIEVTSIDSDKQ